MKTKVLFSALLVSVLLAGCGSSGKDLLDNPKDTDVQAAIETIEGVKNVCLVTEDKDPNKKLNKEGGYTGAVYFRLTQVDDQVSKGEYPTTYGDDSCDVGTEGGGQIEIYKNKDDATKRDAYLANFDGTVLSGSHTVKGTNVIRLSEKLTATQQKDLQEKIIEVLSEKK